MSAAKTFAIEMSQDVPPSKYGVVHVKGCRDLRDPEPVGEDWKAGVSRLGTDWAEEVEDGNIHLANCAR